MTFPLLWALFTLRPLRALAYTAYAFGFVATWVRLLSRKGR